MISSFIIGSLGYPALELLYRRRTHPTMALAGGLAMCTLSVIHNRMKKRPLWQRALLGGVCVTGIEYAIGRWKNRGYEIWDYRKSLGNFQGQVCLPFFAIWCGLSAGVLQVMEWME